MNEIQTIYVLANGNNLHGSVMARPWMTEKTNAVDCDRISPVGDRNLRDTKNNFFAIRSVSWRFCPFGMSMWGSFEHDLAESIKANNAHKQNTHDME